jgi:hypothetical protein
MYISEKKKKKKTNQVHIKFTSSLCYFPVPNTFPSLG